MIDKELNSHDLAREIEIVKLQEENEELKADKEVILSSMLRSMQRDRILNIGGDK